MKYIKYICYVLLVLVSSILSMLAFMFITKKDNIPVDIDVDELDEAITTVKHEQKVVTEARTEEKIVKEEVQEALKSEEDTRKIKLLEAYKKATKIKMLLFMLLFSCGNNAQIPLPLTTTLQLMTIDEAEVNDEKISCEETMQFDPIPITTEDANVINENSDLNTKSGFIIDDCTFARVIIDKQKINRLEVEYEALKVINRKQLNVVEKYETRYQKELSKRDTFYERNKAFFSMAIGIVVGVGISMLTLYGIEEVKNNE